MLPSRSTSVSSDSGGTSQPHATISAQQLAQNNPDKCGFLRKRGKAERLLENLHLSKHINWRQKFVVIKDGCCYCFSDEVAKAPSQSWSLTGYNRVSRKKADRAAFGTVFALEPAAQGKLQVFAASTEVEMKQWMRAFRDAMIAANPEAAGIDSGGSSADGTYDDLEKPLFQSEVTRGRDSNGEHSDEDEDDEEEGSDDSDYDVPDEDTISRAKANKAAAAKERRALPLPPIPGEESNGGRPSGRQSGSSGSSSGPRSPTSPLSPISPKPVTSPTGNKTRVALPGMGANTDPPAVPTRPRPSGGRRGSVDSHVQDQRPPAKEPPKKEPPPKRESVETPKPVSTKPAVTSRALPPQPKPKLTRRVSEKDCFYDNSDRDAAIEIIQGENDVGTCLIRKSRQGDSRVLVVKTSDGVKEYKIFAQNGYTTLDKKDYFNSVDEMLEHYCKASLPNRQESLSRSYSNS